MEKIVVKHMTIEDFAFAVKLTDTMNWDYTEEDFKFMTDLEPKGCFIASKNGERVGITTTIRFDSLGWIGNVIVNQNYRLMGIGSNLVKHAMDYLRSQSVRTIGLYSYMDTIPFYEKIGFKSNTRFIRLVGIGVAGDLGVNAIRKMEEKDLRYVIEFDRLCTGVSRQKLLRRIFMESRDLCYTIFERKRLVGFIMARSAQIGPLVCRPDFEEESINLLRAVLNKLVGLKVYIGVPEKRQHILDFLRNLSFREHFQVARMYYGDYLKDKNCTVAMESLERG